MKAFGALPRRPVTCHTLSNKTCPWLPASPTSDFSSSSRLDKPKTGKCRRSKSTHPASAKSRKDGLLQVDASSKTIQTPSGNLPVSPLMDPQYLSAKMKYKQHKPKQSELPEKKTKFQNRLMRNPYAHALASTLRPCAATKAPLPRFFLLGFNLMAHPTTGETYWVNEELRKPRNMLSAPESKAKPGDKAWEMNHSPEDEPDSDEHDAVAASKPDEMEATDSETGGQAESHDPPPVPSQDHDHEDQQQQQQSSANSNSGATNSGLPPRKRGPTAWVLARQDLLELFPDRDRKLPYSQMHKAFLRMNVSDGSGRLAPALNAAVWRDDMDVLLLELARRRIADALVSFARGCTEQGRNYIIRMRRYEDAKEHKHRGCLLWFSKPQKQQRQQQQQQKEDGGERGEGRRLEQEGEHQESGKDEVSEGIAIRPSVEPTEVREPVETSPPPLDISQERPEGARMPPVSEPPAQLSIMDIDGPWDKKLAVHNMDMLLGEKHVARLRRDSSLFRKGSLFLLGRFATLDLVMRLWKLQGYVKPALHDSPQTPLDAP